MGIVIKNNPIGIDKVITNLQEGMYTALIENGWTNYDCYHRAYKNVKNVGSGDYIPEVYTADSVQSGQYEEVLLNDRVNSTSFFIAGNNTPYDNSSGLFKNDISIIFQINSENLYSNVTHRADEEAKNDVIAAIKEAGYGKYITGIVTHVPDVYNEFDTSKLETDDMHPYFVFRVNLNVNVDYNCNYYCTYPIINDLSGGFEYILDFLMA